MYYTYIYIYIYIYVCVCVLRCTAQQMQLLTMPTRSSTPKPSTPGLGRSPGNLAPFVLKGSICGLKCGICIIVTAPRP